MLVKCCVWVTKSDLKALELEAERLDRTVAWVTRECIELALPAIRAMRKEQRSKRGHRYTPREGHVS